VQYERDVFIHTEAFFILSLNLVHHPADIRQTSFALGVFYGALAIAELFLCLDFLHNQRASI
jgi:hypothetical protein